MRHPMLLFICALALLYAVNCLSERVIDVLNQKEEIVRRLAEQAAELFERRDEMVANCLCSVHTCSFELEAKTCHKEFGTPAVCGNCNGQNIDYNSSVVNTPPGADPTDLDDKLKESICLYRGLESMFRELYPKDYLWTYMATPDGHFRLYPAVGRDHSQDENSAVQGCRDYDPRRRPWYMAASTEPKDIIFIIDRSRYMSRNSVTDGLSKWERTKNAVVSMLDTFSNRDFVNIVTFSDGATQLWKKTRLARATVQNKTDIKALLDGVDPGGGTNYDAAFELAFSLLTSACSSEERTCSNCEKVIIFLTGSKGTSRFFGRGIKPSEMAAKIAGYQDKLYEMTSRRASIFTISFGMNADDSIPRQIACNNGGSWSFVNDTGNPLLAMRNYYLFLASKRDSGNPIWSEPYLDDLGLGMLTSVAVPVYTKGDGNLPRIFLGVIGHDAMFSELVDRESDTNNILSTLTERSSKCNPSEITDCQLQVLRNFQADAATCIDRFPIKSTPPSEEDKPQCFTNGRSFYKRYSSLVSWTKAQDRCSEDGGALVSIGSKEELAFVANMASDDGSWIGARRELDGFVWLDTTSPDLEDNSEAWGIGQPNSFRDVQDCVIIDTRGPSGNLNDAQCEGEHTFICEYDSDDRCEGEVLNPSKQPNQYFNVPPTELCISEVESLSRLRPVEGAANKTSSDAVCPLGSPKSDFEIQCCAECSTKSGLSPLVVVIVLLAILIGIGLFAGFLFFFFKKRNRSLELSKDEPETSPPAAESAVELQPYDLWSLSSRDNISLGRSAFSSTHRSE